MNRCWAIALLMASGGVVSEAASVPKASLTSAELRAKMQESLGRIKGLIVEYQSRFFDEAGRELACYRRTIAAHAPSSYFHCCERIDESENWRDLLSKECFYVKGTTWYRESAVNRAYLQGRLPKETSIPEDMLSEEFLPYTGWWPLDRSLKPRSPAIPPLLPDIVESEDYGVHEERKLRNGYWCHVLKSKSDTLWISEDLGFSLVAREICDRKTGRRLLDIVLKDFHKDQSGVMVPTKIECTRFSKPREVRSQSKDALERTRTIRVDIRRLVVNPADYADIFEYTVPSGALLISGGTRPRQVRPGGLEHLDNLTGALISKRNVPSASMSPKFSCGSLTVLSLGVLLLLLREVAARVMGAGSRRGE